MSAPSSPPLANDPAAARVGVIAGLLTFGIWGLLPLYLKQLADMPPPEVLANRVIWSVVMMAVFIVLLREWSAVLAAFRNRRVILTLIATATLISVNWLTYIYAVSSGHILAASLGYFINPLISVLFGFVFLRERMATQHWIAVGFAALGVGFLIVRLGEVPIVSLTLAFSFATYGLLRKTIPVTGITGMTVESLLMGPVALGYLVWLDYQGVGHFGHDGLARDAMLMLGGPLTAIPLVMFGVAVRRVRLSTIGLMQYIAPSGQFLLATQIYDEPFTATHAWAFSCIWLGLAIYSAPRSWLRELVWVGRPDFPGRAIGMDENPIFTRIRKDIETHAVVLYMEGTPMFPLTNRGAAVTQALDLMGVAYKSVNLNDDPEIRDAIKTAPDAPDTPHLYIHGRFAGGGTEVRDLAKSGALKALLDAAGIAAQSLA